MSVRNLFVAAAVIVTALPAPPARGNVGAQKGTRSVPPRLNGEQITAQQLQYIAHTSLFAAAESARLHQRAKIRYATEFERLHTPVPTASTALGASGNRGSAAGSASIPQEVY